MSLAAGRAIDSCRRCSVEQFLVGGSSCVIVASRFLGGAGGRRLRLGLDDHRAVEGPGALRGVGDRELVDGRRSRGHAGHQVPDGAGTRVAQGGVPTLPPRTVAVADDLQPAAGGRVETGSPVGPEGAGRRRPQVSVADDEIRNHHRVRGLDLEELPPLDVVVEDALGRS
jgi:hypothetical protein